ncbi:MAG: PorT family protein [Firmicutes bacterium]|nr:PorT family protein [Bacillota bacterium]MCM1402170.1 PorT family protein [Bacteroides sp.]MCM1477751.1 PorT family protein [Bacteroides sp.]
MKDLKRIAAFIVVAVMINVLPAAAQSNDVDNKPMFGLKAGIDVDIPGKWHNPSGSIKMYRPGFGFNLGGVCNVYLGKGFYLEPGVSLYYDTYSTDNFSVTGPNGEIYESDPRVWKMGARVPVVVGYVLDIGERFSMSIFTGPEVNYSFAGDYSIKNKEAMEMEEMDLFAGQRRLDCAWKVGVGFPVGSMMVSAEVAIGLTDLMKNPDLSFRENRATLGLTYYF